MEAFEAAAWPALGNRPFTATQLDVNGFGQREADEMTALFDQHGLTLSSLAFYDNNLHLHPTERKNINTCVLALIDAVTLLGVPTVTASRRLTADRRAADEYPFSREAPTGRGRPLR